MKKYIILLIVALAVFSPSNVSAQTSAKYKCMIQMTNYMGEGAYIVISLINPKGEYEKTLYVMGSDKKWYPDLKEWHNSQKKKPANLSTVTGASISGGDRSIKMIELEKSKIDAGYTLRFESAVENQKYHVKDLEIPLTAANLNGKTDGTNYIRYVRLIPN